MWGRFALISFSASARAGLAPGRADQVQPIRRCAARWPGRWPGCGSWCHARLDVSGVLDIAQLAEQDAGAVLGLEEAEQRPPFWFRPDSCTMKVSLTPSRLKLDDAALGLAAVVALRRMRTTRPRRLAAAARAVMPMRRRRWAVGLARAESARRGRAGGAGEGAGTRAGSAGGGLDRGGDLGCRGWAGSGAVRCGGVAVVRGGSRRGDFLGASSSCRPLPWPRWPPATEGDAGEGCRRRRDGNFGGGRGAGGAGLVRQPDAFRMQLRSVRARLARRLAPSQPPMPQKARALRSATGGAEAQDRHALARARGRSGRRSAGRAGRRTGSLSRPWAGGRARPATAAAG